MLSKDDTNKNQEVEGSTSLSPEAYQYLGFTFTGIAVLSLLVTFCLCSRIRLCIAVIKCSARYVGDVSSVLFVPVLFFFITLGYIFYWIITATYLLSCGEPNTTSPK